MIMPRYRVEVCFTTCTHYYLEVDAASEEDINEDEVIARASEIEVPDRVEAFETEILDIEELEIEHTLTAFQPLSIEDLRYAVKHIENWLAVGGGLHDMADLRIEFATYNAEIARRTYQP